MTRQRTKRLLSQKLYPMQLEHPITNFWLLLQGAPNQTQTGDNRPYRKAVIEGLSRVYPK